MFQKSEKIICIKLQNLVLKKVFTELILILNEEINDIEFILFNSSDKIIKLPHYVISDKESIMQLIDEDISKTIKKIFLISSMPIDIKTNIEIINYDLPFNFLNFIDYLNATLNVPKGLKELGVLKGGFDQIIDGALKDPSKACNPIELNSQNLRTILNTAL